MFHLLPSRILDLLAVPPGTVILDPFCGSGTVLVEALARRCHPIGIDLNPIARLISRAKTTPLRPIDLEQTLAAILATPLVSKNDHNTNLPEYWFAPSIRHALHTLFQGILKTAPNSFAKTLFLASLTSITRRCSLADPFIPPPVKMRVQRFPTAGPRYRAAYRRAMSLGVTDVYRLFERTARKNILRLSTFPHPGTSPATVLPGSALAMDLSNESIDVVITSPPYCGAQKYIRTFRLELLLLGYSTQQIASLEKSSLGTEKAIWTDPSPSPALTQKQSQLIHRINARNPTRAQMLQLYLHGLHQFSTELYRVMKPSSNAFITFGTSHFSGIPVDLGAIFSELIEPSGFALEAMFTDRIRSRLMITKRHSSANVIPTENILWIRKPH